MRRMKAKIYFLWFPINAKKSEIKQMHFWRVKPINFPAFLDRIQWREVQKSRQKYFSLSNYAIWRYWWWRNQIPFQFSCILKKKVGKRQVWSAFVFKFSNNLLSTRISKFGYWSTLPRASADQCDPKTNFYSSCDKMYCLCF